MRKIKKLLALMLTVVMITLTVAITPVHAAGEWDEINHRRWVTCSTCGGSGSKKESCPKTATYTCSSCNGTGSYSYTGNCYPSCTKGSQYYPCPGVLPGGSVCSNWSAGIYCSGHYKGVPCGSSSNHSGTVTNCPLTVTSTCTTCSGTGTKTVSCSTGSYQYDTIAPTLSLTKSIDADSPSYAGQAVTVTANANDNLSGVYQYQFGGGAWQSSNAYTVPSTAGSVTVTCSVKDNAGNVSSTAQIAVKTMQNQSQLVITEPIVTTYGTTFKLVVTGGTTSKPIVYKVGSGNATVDTDGYVTPTGVGSVSITATMPGNTNYYDVSDTVIFTIAPKQISTTGTISVSDKVYDGNVTVPLDTPLDLVGVVGDDDIMLNMPVATFVNSNVGTDKVVTISSLTLNGADTNNYTLSQPILTGYKASVTAKNLTVADTMVTDKIYDGTTTATYLQSPSLVGTVAGDAIALQGGTPSFKTASKGENNEILFAPFTLEGADKGNYSLTQPIAATANITALQVTVADITVKDKVYDGRTTAEFSTSPTLVGVKSGDKVTLVPGTPTFSDKSANVHEVSYSPFSLTGTDSDNYAIVQPGNVQATITPRALSVKEISVDSKAYDGSTSATAIIELNNVISGDVIIASYNEALFDNANVGVDKLVTVNGITLKGDDKSNYTLATTTEKTTGEITPKVVTLLPTPKITKVYGTAEPVFAYTHSELVGDDKITGDITRAVGEDVGEYEYILDKLITSKNYTLQLNPKADKFTVTKATGSVSITSIKTGSVPINIELSATLPCTDGEVEFYILGEKVKSVKATGSIVKATYKPLTVGEYNFTCKLVGAKNYVDTISNAVAISVSTADITVPVLPAPPVADGPRADDTVTTSEPAPKLEVMSDIAVSYTPPLSVPDPWWENELLQSALDETPPPADNSTIIDPNLVVIDVTEGVDLAMYTALLEQQHIDKEVIGVYSARLFIGDEEVNPDGTVEVTLPISGRLAEFDGHDVFQVTDTLTQVLVKSASATAISFDTDSLGYFAVVGIPAIKQLPAPTIPPQIDWLSIFLWCVLGIVLLGVVFLLILLWRKKKDEDKE